MAITYIVGLPGTGKSYLAVYSLWRKFVYVPKKDTFLSKLLGKLKKPMIEKDYEIAYTNINGFNFEKTDKIKPLDFEVLKANLTELYAMYKQKKTDDELIELAKPLGLYKAMFVFDECHNYLKAKEDEVLVWWLTYHRHFYQDIFFITQDLALVNSEYKRIAEFFYKAITNARKLSTKSFKYVQFGSYKMYKADIVEGGTKVIPHLNDVFDMYVSGDKNNAKSVVQKYLLFAVLLIALIFPAFAWFLSSFDTEEIKDTNTTQIQQQTQSRLDPKDINKKDLLKNDEIDYKSTFSSYSISCVDELCILDNARFPRGLLMQVINKFPPEFYYINKDFNNDFLYVVYKEDFLSFLKNGVTKNDKKDTKNTRNTALLPKLY